MRVGVVLFDDPQFLDSEESRGGWYSIAAQKAGRFTLLTDLPSDVVWVSNVEYAKYMEHGIGKQLPGLRNAGFFGTALGAITNDLKLDPESTRLDTSVIELSRVVDRVFRALVRVYGSESVVGHYTVAKGIRSLLLGENEEPMDVALNHALVSSYQRFSRCTYQSRFRGLSARYVTVKKNRMAHAADVLQTLVPIGKPSFVGTDKMPGANRLAWLLSLGQPFLARVSASNVDQEVAPILGFGAMRGPTGMSVPREWVTSIEALLLDAFATVSVQGAWIWPESGSIPRRYGLPAGLIQDPWMELSYSAQLIADSHLAALSMTPKRPRMMGGGVEVSPMAAWLSAMDRIASFEMAKLLIDEGINPTSYGGGSATVRLLTDEDRAKLNALVRDSGWALPLPMVESIEAEHAI